jgi:cyanophycin synthetase
MVASDDWIEERVGRHVERIVRIEDVPATLGGTADFQIANALAAAAACRAAGVDRLAIAQGLATFTLDQHSVGRLNLYALNNGYVLLDYGHNPAAIQAVCRTVSRWGAARITQILTVPGDRSDSLIEDAARAALCGADRVIVREDDDRRGRRTGEIAQMLEAVIKRERPGLPVSIVLDELAAVQTAVRELQPGEVVVALSEDLDKVAAWLREQGAQPVTDFDSLDLSIRRKAQPAA